MVDQHNISIFFPLPYEINNENRSQETTLASEKRYHLSRRTDSKSNSQCINKPTCHFTNQCIVILNIKCLR
ncbi:hypothetical protein Leryth_013051 [Lithospermum erythrorhizon]|nr:hypothetical protein Leryth_013051 [Lithospermum erythrorhizon]